MFFVYVLQSLKNNKKYVGMTQNVEERLRQHNAGKSRFTKGHTPWKFLYYEEFKTFEEARNREKYFKSGFGREELKRILTNL